MNRPDDILEALTWRQSSHSYRPENRGPRCSRLGLCLHMHFLYESCTYRQNDLKRADISSHVANCAQRGRHLIAWVSTYTLRRRLNASGLTLVCCKKKGFQGGIPPFPLVDERVCVHHSDFERFATDDMSSYNRSPKPSHVHIRKRFPQVIVKGCKNLPALIDSNCAHVVKYFRSELDGSAWL